MVLGIADVTYASATGANARESVVEGIVGAGAGWFVPTAVGVGAPLVGFGVEVFVTAGTEVGDVEDFPGGHGENIHQKG